MTHITIEKAKLEKVFYALTAAKHGNLDHEWTEEVLAICKQALAAAVQEPVAWPMEEQPDGSIIPVDPSELPSDYFTTPPAAQQEPIAQAWAEGYRAGIDDERTSEANIGIAGMDMKVEPARNNPHHTTPPKQPAPVQPVAWREALERIADPRNTHFAGDAQVVARDALATPPAAQRQWVGLTPTERKQIEKRYVFVEDAIRLTEAKLKEKNNG